MNANVPVLFYVTCVLTRCEPEIRSRPLIGRGPDLCAVIGRGRPRTLGPVLMTGWSPLTLLAALSTEREGAD